MTTSELLTWLTRIVGWAKNSRTVWEQATLTRYYMMTSNFDHLHHTIYFPLSTWQHRTVSVQYGIHRNPIPKTTLNMAMGRLLPHFRHLVLVGGLLIDFDGLAIPAGFPASIGIHPTLDLGRQYHIIWTYIHIYIYIILSATCQGPWRLHFRP